MTESVGILERLANEDVPPIRRGELDKIRDAYSDPASNKEDLDKQLSVMKTAFKKRGNLKLWDRDPLERIDEIFEECFMCDGEASSWLFARNNHTNLEQFGKYCLEVDRALAMFSDKVPRYARDWFAYYCIWEVHGYLFPMPLGTSKAVGALEQMAQTYRNGIVEVSSNPECFPPPSFRHPYYPCSLCRA